MKDVDIEFHKDNFSVYTPYDENFVKSIKMIGGSSWNPSTKAWRCPMEMLDVVRGIMVDIYGCDDTYPLDLVTLEVTVGDSIVYATRKNFMMFGKAVAIAFSRDSGAVAGKDVAYLKGRCYSAGSSKNWCSEIEAGSVIRIFHVNKYIFEKQLESFDADMVGYTVKVIAKEDRNELLKKEKLRLQQKLDEINAVLDD